MLNLAMPCGICLRMRRKSTADFGDECRGESVVERICVGVVVVPCKESAGANQAINRSNSKEASSCRYMKTYQPPSFWLLYVQGVPLKHNVAVGV